DERVALLEVDGLLELVGGEVETAGVEAGQGGGGGDAVAGEGGEVAVRDRRAEGGPVDDQLERVAQAVAVAARGGGGEPEQGARPRGVEGAELAEDAAVVLGGGVVALVVDHEADVAAGGDLLQPLLVERADGTDDDARVRRGAELA